MNLNNSVIISLKEYKELCDIKEKSNSGVMRNQKDILIIEQNFYKHIAMFANKCSKLRKLINGIDSDLKIMEIPTNCSYDSSNDTLTFIYE